MKFNRLLLGIFSLATLTASSMVMPPITSAAPKICSCAISQARPERGQKSRSSGNFSTQGCARSLIWNSPKGVSFTVVKDVSAGKDRVEISNVKHGLQTQNPNQEKLYIANPRGALVPFRVCAIDLS
ncbi:DeoR family transcriptional regulator [Chamaesiphon sp. VAR_48_metabat_403]|uniref:DeoR family transcriptional regulator n=1 Tax=Chamaesiphon sp. VAR_48_metabat_403 TaxID=2964700 RepID=UPI00286E16DE|nr:DeoR family transcriptional regulator [Chamaesiphon sp. VAR_48_metabat_403]